MAVPRNETQRQRDRLLISDLYLQGVTQQEIADKLGLHRNTVSSDIKYLLKEWKKKRESIPDEFEARYRYIYREALTAWQHSKEDAETTIQEMIDGGDSGNGSQRLKASTRKEGQSGNPALLAQAQAALKAIREMFGIDAATLVDIPKDSNFEAALKRAYGQDDSDQNSDQT